METLILSIAIVALGFYFELRIDKLKSEMRELAENVVEHYEG